MSLIHQTKLKKICLIFDNTELDDFIFDIDLLCNDFDKTSIMSDKELYKSVNLYDGNHQPSLSKTDSGKIYQRSRSSKIQSLHKFPQLIDLPDTGTVYGSPTSFADKSKYFLHFNQSQTSKNTATKYDLRPQPRKFLSFPSTTFLSA